MDFNPDKIYAALVKAGEDWADLDSAASLLEETKKSVLAELVNQAEEKSVAAKESVALADPVYKLHVHNMVIARQKANTAKVRYDAQKVLSELRRTEQSNIRAEVTLR